MKKIFRKAMTVLGSAVLIGATVGMAAATTYPDPFTSNTAIVVGANAAPSDNIAASSIASNLDASASATGGVVTATEGDIVPLDTGSTRIFLNTSLNTAKSILTKSDLPVVLGDSTFSGNVDAKLTSTIKILGGATDGGSGSNKVIFDRQPSSSDDPVVGISLGGSSQPFYNVSFTSKAIAFNNTDSEGETIRLFGRDFVVSTATDATSIVLFSSAKEVNLVAGGDNPNPTATVVIDGKSYDIELVTGTSSTATIAVNGESKEINEGSSKKVNGVDIAIKSVTESTALNTVTASVLVGSNKLTFTDGQAVTQGSDDENIDGTKAYITGGPGATTKLTVTVFRPSSSDDAVLPGKPFVDPVFGSFKVDFAGLNIPLDDPERSEIKVSPSGDKGVELSMTDSDGNDKSFIFAYNASGQTFLGDANNYTIGVMEMSNMTLVAGNGGDKFIVLGNEEYGHLLELTTLTNNTGTDYTKDKVRLTDVFDGTNYDTVFTSEGVGTMTIDGKSYGVTFNHSDEAGYVQFKYPTGDSADANTAVIYPTIKAKGGELVALYEPLTLNLTGFDGKGNDLTTIKLPDGDGYTSIANVYSGTNSSNVVWTIGGSSLNTSAAADTSFVTATVGQLVYNFTSTGTANQTKLYVTNPEDNSTNIVSPGLIIFEQKDDSGNYEAIVVDTESNPAGTSSDGYAVNDVMFSSPTMYEKSMKDSDFTQNLDWYGVLATTDKSDSDQPTITLSFPDSQVYAQIYVGEIGASVSDGASVGVMTVKDSEVASVAGKNLIVVGGSAINSVAADLLGGAYRGEAFTSATGVAAGEFLIQSFDRSGKTALLVAGYNGPDTEKAVTYLLNNNVDTSIGKKYKGTSATEASLVVA